LANPCKWEKGDERSYDIVRPTIKSKFAIFRIGAVGFAGLSSTHPFTEHWNGSKWSVVSAPDLGLSAGPNSVAALASNDVWAVGSSSKGALTEHWNGSSWSVISDPAGSSAALNGVAQIPNTSTVSAVGAISTNTLVQHWNGTKWIAVPSPNPVGASSSTLNALAAISAPNVWAVVLAWRVGCLDPGGRATPQWPSA